MWLKTSEVTRPSEDLVSESEGLLSVFTTPRAPQPRPPLRIFPSLLEPPRWIHFLLVCNAGGNPRWSWDASYPPDTIMAWGNGLNFQSLLGQAATTPSLSEMVLRCGDLNFPYDVYVLPNKESLTTPGVSVQDIFYSLYGNLRTPLAPKEYSILSSDSQKDLATAYHTRVNRIVDPTKRETERRKGLKRIDYLIAAGRTYFIGLVATESKDIFIAHFAPEPYNPGWAHVHPIVF
jgi:hypothetical protein